MQVSFFKDPIVRSFAVERPFVTVTQMVLWRILAPGDIDLVFEEHAEEQCHRSLLFSSLTCLVSGVVLGKHASMNAGYKKMKEQLAVSVTAVYKKLQRVELPLVQQLVRQSY
ncbi:hypothetical protein [Novipirellula sp.]|uniref:hypothetical protein n=1 Tax=Novipirellula sp. TaxID=2795430 RepID=UPI003565A673